MIYYKRDDARDSVFELPHSQFGGIDGYFGVVAAQMCAEDYYANHDGGASRWPLTLLLAETPDSPTWKSFYVDIHVVPQFSAKESGS